MLAGAGAQQLRTVLLCARLADQFCAFDRFIMGTDTPTGSGMMQTPR